MLSQWDRPSGREVVPLAPLVILVLLTKVVACQASVAKSFCLPIQDVNKAEGEIISRDD